jgi:hypothetical protein
MTKNKRPKRPQKFDARYWDRKTGNFNEDLFKKELREWDEWAERNPYEGPSGFVLLESISTKNRGTTFITIRKVGCPNCGEDFTQEVKEGCFDTHAFPMACPYCGYPFRRRA